LLRTLSFLIMIAAGTSAGAVLASRRKEQPFDPAISPGLSEPLLIVLCWAGAILTIQRGIPALVAIAVWIMAGFLAAYTIHRCRDMSRGRGPRDNATGVRATTLPEYSQSPSGGQEPEGRRGGWRTFAIALGGFQSRLALMAIYFSILALFGLTVGRFGNLLNLRVRTGESCWTPRESRRPSLKDARRQF